MGRLVIAGEDIAETVSATTGTDGKAVVFNTIDSGAPSSRVLPITQPPVGTNIFTVTWTAEDDGAGSGIASLDLYGSSDGTNYIRWVDGLTNAVSYAGAYGATGSAVLSSARAVNLVSVSFSL